MMKLETKEDVATFSVLGFVLCLLVAIVLSCVPQKAHGQEMSDQTKDCLLQFGACGLVSGAIGFYTNPPNQYLRSHEGKFLKVKITDDDGTVLYYDRAVKRAKFDPFWALIGGTAFNLVLEASFHHGPMDPGQLLFGEAAVVFAPTGLALAYF